MTTEMIFGGSMWGESTPESLEYGGIFKILPRYEDGWRIIPWFLIMGWGLLYGTMKLWFLREKLVSGPGLRRGRSVADAKAAAVYCIALAIPLADAVAGDYCGLGDSFISFAVIAFPVHGHELLRPTSAEHVRQAEDPWLDLAFGVGAAMLGQIISILLGFR